MNRIPIIIALCTALVGVAGAETLRPDVPDINGEKPGNCIVEVNDDPIAGEEAIVNITSNAPDTTILIRNKWYRVFRGQAPVEGLVLKPDQYEITAKATDFKTTEFDYSFKTGKSYDLGIWLEQERFTDSENLGITGVVIVGIIGVIALVFYIVMSISPIT